MTDTPRLALPLIDGEQALKHITHNEALTILDGIVQLVLEQLDATVPPVTPALGSAYDIGTGATGAWSGRDTELAVWTEGGWRFVAPADGWLGWSQSDIGLYVRLAGQWVALSSLISTLQNLALLGVNTTADATNKLAVRSNAALLTALETGDGGTGDMRLTLNKQGASETGSIVFQTAFSGRAEIGLTGSDDFAFKVSADGASFSTGLTIAAADGNITFGQLVGADVSFPVVGAGTLTPLTSFVVPAPETGTSDDIDTVAGGNEGALLVVTGTAGNTLTFKDGTGNLKLGADRVLDNFEDSLLLVKRASDWIELAYANNG